MSADDQQAKGGPGAPRVGRPPRLSAVEVVDAAIDLADAEGLDALSMPKLAKRLGIGTMTIYGYVENKDDLLDQMAARVFEGLRFVEAGGLQPGMVRFFADFRDAALVHPTLAKLLATGRVAIPAVFDVLESVLRGAVADGTPADEAIEVFYAALSYTIGFVLWEIPRAHLQTDDDYAGQWADLIAQLDVADHPLVTGVGPSAFRGVASPRQFEVGLERIVTQRGDAPTKRSR